MPTGWILKEMKPGELKNHPESIDIYGTQELDAELLADIKEYGVREPIRVTKDHVVLSGHRRRQHAIAGKVKTVPVLVARHAIPAEEQVIEIVQSNRFREKTVEQTAREFYKLSEAKAAIARKRQKTGKPTDLPLKKTEGVPESQIGEAKAEAAAEVGMSRTTAEKALAVVEKIDELEERGHTKKAERLREVLNEGNVSRAAREAGVNGHKKEEEPATPFDDHILRCDTVLKTYVPKVQEFAIDIEQLLGKNAGDFSANKISNSAKVMHHQFEAVRRILLNAQQRHRRKA